MRWFFLVILTSFAIGTSAVPVDMDTAKTRAKALTAFIAKAKFGPEEPAYAGVQDLKERAMFSIALDDLSRELMPLAGVADPKKPLLAAFERHWTKHEFELADTEDRERVLAYYEELMSVFDVASSDGLLNRFMYGSSANQSSIDRNSAAWAAMTEPERLVANDLKDRPLGEVLRLLTAKLGTPQLNGPGTTGWMLGAKGDNTIALTSKGSKSMLVWMLRGQVWSVELQPAK